MQHDQQDHGADSAKPTDRPMTHPLAALIAGVQHWRPEYPGVMVPSPNGVWVDHRHVLAALEAAPHVNETPKTEHDGADVLSATPPDLVEAGKVLEGVTPGPWKANYSKWEPSNFIVQTDHPCRRVLAKFDGDGDGPDAQSIADARFIAWCREGVPALIALATAQAAQIAGLEAEKQEMAAGMVTLSHDQSMAEAAYNRIKGAAT